MSEEHFVRARKYQGSSEWMGAIGLATVFTIVGILAIVFWFFDIDFIGLKWWGYWLFIPAFFIYIGGISTYISQDRLKRETLAALDSYSSGPVDVDTLAKDLMMERASLMRLLIDLRTERGVKFRVDSKSGAIILGESFTPAPVEAAVPTEAPTDAVFCPQCGVRMPAESVFCPNCGASLT